MQILVALFEHAAIDSEYSAMQLYERPRPAGKTQSPTFSTFSQTLIKTARREHVVFASTDAVRGVPSVAEGGPELTRGGNFDRVATDDETQTGQQTAIDGAGGDAAVPV